jgi:hypothetical protein
VLLGFALAAPSVAVGPTAAGAASATTMSPDSVVPVPGPGVTLAVPADGRLNGYGFAGQILGAATGRQLPGADAVRAAAGQQLWVFGLSWTADVTTNQAAVSATVHQVAATVVADGTRIAIPVTQPQIPDADYTSAQPVPPAASGDEYFVASVPAGAADVMVELATGGFAQDFSLTHMTREGNPAAALYRSTTSWETVDAANADVTLPTNYQPPEIGNIADNNLYIDLPTVALSEFGPQGATQTAPAGQAWLIPALTDPFNPNKQDPSQAAEFFTPITTSGLTLTVPGLPALHPQQFPGGPDAQGGGSGSNGVFPDIYAFEVPVGTTTATLTVAPGTQMVTAAFSGSPEQPVAVPSTNFAITFPVPQVPVPPSGAATAPASFGASQLTATPRSHHQSSGFPVLMALLVAAAIAIAALGALIIHRRSRLIPAAPTGPSAATWPPVPPTPPPAPPQPQRAAAPPIASHQPTVLVVPPHGPPPLEPGQIRVLVLGQPTVEGLSPAVGQTPIEILIFLALHPGQSFTTDQLRTRLSGLSDSRNIGPDTIRRYMSELRRFLGPERIPEGGGRGYQAVEVHSDLEAMQKSLQAATAVGDPADKARHLAEALAWVRAAPLADAPKNSYEWADNEPDLAPRASMQIRSAALELAGLALDAGDAALARWAAEQGLRSEPTDQALQRHLRPT